MARSKRLYALRIMLVPITPGCQHITLVMHFAIGTTYSYVYNQARAWLTQNQGKLYRNKRGSPQQVCGPSDYAITILPSL